MKDKLATISKQLAKFVQNNSNYFSQGQLVFAGFFLLYLLSQ
jgi:hypothetical protein